MFTISQYFVIGQFINQWNLETIKFNFHLIISEPVYLSLINMVPSKGLKLQGKTMYFIVPMLS